MKNSGLNAVHIVVNKGDIGVLQPRLFNSILANITRNVLLVDIPLYSAHLHEHGQLLGSGLLTEDSGKIKMVAHHSELTTSGR